MGERSLKWTCQHCAERFASEVDLAAHQWNNKHCPQWAEAGQEPSPMTDHSTTAKRAAERKYPHRGHPFDLERQAHISAYMDLLPYVQHRPECVNGGLVPSDDDLVPSTDCTCGLDEILNP